MREITNLKDFRIILKKISLDLKLNGSFGSHAKLEHSIEFDFDYVMIKSFHNIAKRICFLNGEEEYLYQILDPSPLDYSFKEFNSYCSFVFNQEDDESTFLGMLNLELGGSDIDCPSIIADIICITDFSFNWCIYANRYEGIGRFFTNDEKLFKRSLKTLKNAPYFTGIY